MLTDTRAEHAAHGARRMLTRALDEPRRRRERHAAKQALARVARLYPTTKERTR